MINALLAIVDAQGNQFRVDVTETLEHAEVALRLASEQGLPLCLAGGSILKGWSLAERRRAREGLAQVRTGLADGN